jgi:hypothetical protein
MVAKHDPGGKVRLALSVGVKGKGCLLVVPATVVAPAIADLGQEEAARDVRHHEPEHSGSFS